MEPKPSSNDPWNELAQAIEDVDHLSMDPEFEKIMRQQSILESFQLFQGHSPIITENNELFHGSTLTRYLPTPTVKIDCVNMRVDLRGSFLDATGSLEINDRKLAISSESGNLLLHDTTQPNMPPVPIEPEDITNFLLATAANFLKEKQSSVEAIIYAHQNTEDELERLGSAIFMFGSLIGASSHTIQSYFKGQNQEIIAKFTELESPDNSEISNQLLLSTPTDLDPVLADEVIARNHQTAVIDEFTADERMAVHQIAVRPIGALDIALSDNPFQAQPGAVYVDYSKGADAREVQHYGLLCRELLTAYRQLTYELTTTEEQP